MQRSYNKTSAALACCVLLISAGFIASVFFVFSRVVAQNSDISAEAQNTPSAPETALTDKNQAESQQTPTTTESESLPISEPAPEPIGLSEIAKIFAPQEPVTIDIPQQNKDITVKAKTEVIENRHTNREGLSITKGDIESRPQDILFFQQQGTKKETIMLTDLAPTLDDEIKKAQEEQGGSEQKMPSVAVQGGEAKKLSEVQRIESQGNAVSIDVENIKVEKKDQDGLIGKAINFIFGKKQDQQTVAPTFSLEVTPSGEVKLLNAQNLTGSESLTIEYGYGIYAKAFELSSATALLANAPFSIENVSADAVAKEAKKIENKQKGVLSAEEEEAKKKKEEEDKKAKEAEQNAVLQQEQPATKPDQDIQQPQPSPQQQERGTSTTTETKPNTEQAQTQPSSIQPTLPEPQPVQTTAQSTVNATTTPQVEGARTGESEENQDKQGTQQKNIWERIKEWISNSVGTGRYKYVGSSLKLEPTIGVPTLRIGDIGGVSIAYAQSQSQTVQAFQVKLKAATNKKEQTFQILPDGTIYLFHGESIEAIAKPKFQYAQSGKWANFTIIKAKVGTSSTSAKATHLIQFTTEEGDAISLKYDFGLENNQILKKQTWAIEGDKKVRVVWETLFRTGTKAQKELLARCPFDSSQALGAGLCPVETRTNLYGEMVIDTADYKGNVAIEEDSANNIVRVYFEKDGTSAPLIVDPSFSVITSDQFIEIATPDFGENQTDGSSFKLEPTSVGAGGGGWKIRFNRLKGGGIDQYFRNTVSGGATNIASNTKTVFNIAYSNTTAKNLSEVQAYSMDVIERGDTRVRVRSHVNLGKDAWDIYYTVYLAGQIYVDAANILQDGSIAGQSGLFQLNQSYSGYQSEFAVQDARTASAAIDSSLIGADAVIIPFTGTSIGAITSLADQTDDYIQVALGANTSAGYANNNTASNQFLLSLATPQPSTSQEEVEGSTVGSSLKLEPTTLAALARDYQTPDSLTPFTIGTFQGYNNKEGAYEMTAQNIKVEFVMDGATTTRYQPVFKIANWTSEKLGAVFAKVEGQEIRQDVDYILTFQNGDPATQVLVFQYLGIVDKELKFWIDPTFTSARNGNWNIGTTWAVSGGCASSCVADTDFPGSGTTSATIQHTVTISGANATIGGNILINTAGKLTFETTTGRTLTVNENAGSAIITVGSSDGATAGTLECRGATSGNNIIKLNDTTGTATSATVGIEVETKGFLDIQGTSATSQNCQITKGDGTLSDGTKNGYIWLKNGSETLIKNADVSYMGANVANKLGINAVAVNGNVANDGLLIEGSSIHNNYQIYLSNSTYAVIRNSKIYSHTLRGIEIQDGAANHHLIAYNEIYNNGATGINLKDEFTTVIGNVFQNNGTFGNIAIGTTADSNFVYNNTLNSPNSADNIRLYAGAGTNGANVIKNNLITNAPAGSEGIDDRSALGGATIQNNFYYNNGTGGTAHCSSINNSCGTVASGSGGTITYVSTTGGNVDFLYLSEDSPALAVGMEIINGTAGTPTNCNGGTVPCINVGGRLDFVRNGTHATPSKYNWLQQAHDDATGDVLSAGDTVTAYANNVITATVVANISAVGTIGTAYYQVKFDIADTTITASDQHEGFYAYFTSGANRGRQYLIVDSVEAVTDTMTILSAQANTTFTAGDGFTIVDRVYSRDSNESTNCTGTENLCITKAGNVNGTAPITWNTSGTVIVDAGNTRTYGFDIAGGDYNVISGFTIINATDGIRLTNVNNSLYQSLIIARNTGMGVNDGSGNQDNVFYNNIVFGNTSHGFGAVNQSHIINNTVFGNSGRGIDVDGASAISGNVLWNNANSVFLKGAGNAARGNRVIRDTAIGITLNTPVSNIITNNTIVGNTTNGIGASSYSGSSNKIRDNLITGSATGISFTAGAGDTSNFNYFYNNTTNVSGISEGAGALPANGAAGGTDPGFYTEVSAVVLAAGATTTTVDLTGTQAWTENQWVGAGLTFTGGSCNIAANTWFGITSNTAEMLFFAPAASAVPNTSCTGVVTNFYIANTTGATTPLGNGASHAGTAKPTPASVNMGARLEYVVNDDQASADIKHNFLQDAHDHANVNAGDTITAYAVNEVSDTLGTTLTDNGPYLTLDTATEATIGASDDFIGFYIYMTSGTNRGKYYLIIDSAENAGTDTISISATDGTSLNTTGFNVGDGFTIVDRVYARESGSANANCTSATEGLCLYTSGTSTAPITWTTSGAVIIDSAGTRSYGIDIANADYNIVSGFTVIGGLLDGIRLTNVNNSRYASLVVARNTAMGINDGTGNQDNLFESNTVFGNTSHGIGSVNQSLVSGNTVYGNSGRGIDITANSAVYNNLLAGNANSIFVAGAGNMVRANRIVRDTIDGVVLSGAANNAKITNNMIAGDTSDGIDGSAYSGTGSVLRNNLIMNHGIGINSVGSGITSNFNYLFNTTQASGGVSEGASSIPASGSGAGTDPAFVAETNGSGTATGGSTTTLIDTGKSWTANQWANYVLHITGGTGANQWGLIIGNTATTLYVTPAFGTATASGSVYQITNFYLVSTSGTTPLGNGVKHDGTTGSAGVNMGARLEYVSNSDGTRNNGLQYAADATATGAGDTLTVYAVDEVTSGTVSSAADSGPYVTLTLSTDSIAADDNFIGMYLYMTSGTNNKKYYLIIDSATVAGPADTIAINTAATTGFAANDTFKIVDRAYTTTGWTSGTTTANARFTKDGSSGSPITWNAVASNSVLIDASGKTYGFYGDTDGTNGLKYNNFQTAGTFTFVNVSNGANLYQGGFGFNATSVAHDHVNWGGTTNPDNSIFAGAFTSQVIDMGVASPVYGQLLWSQTVTSGTSAITFQLRSSNDPSLITGIGIATFLGPDGLSTSKYTNNAGTAISTVHNGNRYIQYRATLITSQSDILPELNTININQDATLTSSWFNTESNQTLLSGIKWTEADSAGVTTLPPGSDVLFQVQSAPDNGSGAPNTGSASGFCGPTVCDGTSYFTDPSGILESLPAVLKDSANDQWIQYKVKLTQTGAGKPYVEDFTFTYVINTNTPPTVAVTSVSQDAVGATTVAYNLSDAEEAGCPSCTPPTPAEDGIVVTGLYYDRGVTLGANIATVGATSMTLASGGGALLPLSSGTILIDNEILTYVCAGVCGDTVTIARAAESSKNTTHNSGSAVWIKAVTVTGNVGTQTAVTATPAAKTITWTPKTDIDGVYNLTFPVRVVANDGNAANQVGYAGSTFELDTKNPTIDTFTIDANNATAGSVTLAIIKTDNTTVTMNFSNNSGLTADGVNTDSGTYITFAASKPWVISSDTTTQPIVYLRLKDAKGNTSTIANVKPPVTPQNLVVVDTSNVGTGDYRLFISWKMASAADAPAFSEYRVYRKVGSGAAYSGSGSFTLVSTITNRTINYFTNTDKDASLPITQAVQYDYFIVTKATDANISYRSNGVCGILDGGQNCSEGGGGDDNTGPTIVYTQSTGQGTASNSQIIITFSVYDLPASPGTIRDANVEYDTIAGAYNFSQGIPTAQSGTSAGAPANRPVTVTGLKGNTTYYYRLTALDASGNIGINNGTGAGYTFTTSSDAGPIISNIQAIKINATTFKITWTTDKTASSKVTYSKDANLASSNASTITTAETDTSTRVTSHQVQFTGLDSGATYYYKVTSQDSNNNTSSGPTSPPFNIFTTIDTTPPVISSVVAADILHNSATITFTTNKVAYSQIEYGQTLSYGSSAMNSNFNTNHVFSITGLTPLTQYFFKVTATDASGNSATNDNSAAGYTFTTLAAPSTAFTNVQTTTVSATAVNITWNTTLASSSQVEYGTNADLSGSVKQPVSPSDLIISHSISLTALSQATRYYYRAISGASQSPIYNFLTGDTTAPVITAISAVYNDKTAVIIWTTNEFATSQVEYGSTNSYGSLTTVDDLLTTIHSVTLTDLKAAETYHYRVKSKDGLGNATASDDKFFTTNAGVNSGPTVETSPPIISNITAFVSDTGATITWTTNKDSDSQVVYGLTNSYGSQTALSSTLTKDHTLRLSDLTPSTTYHFQIKTTDAIGNLVTSTDQTLATNAGKFKFEAGGGGAAPIIIDKNDTRPAMISNFAVGSIGETTATAGWQTDEPAITILAFGEGVISDITGDESTIRNRASSHSITIKQLTPGTGYRVQPIAIDAGGNVTQGEIGQFTTKGVRPLIADLTQKEPGEEKPKPTPEAIKKVIEEQPVNEEGKLILSEKFDEFIRKLEVYLGPPIIVGVTVSDITDKSAVITWKTTVPTATILDYGATEEYGAQARLLQFDQEHKVWLKNLKENALYHYRIKGVTESGQLVSTQDLVFRTTEVPRSGKLIVNDIQEHSVVASWDTNVPSTSEVEYGIVGGEGLQKQGKEAFDTSHRLLITGLKERTRYRIHAISRDISEVVIDAPFVEFTTSVDDQPPLMSGLEAEGLLTKRENVQVFISWQTDEPATSQVFYDIGVVRGRTLSKKTTKDENYTTNHIIIVSDFVPGTLYQLRAESLDRTGNKSQSEDYTIITPKKDENIIDIIVTQFQDAFGFLKR